MKLQWLKRAPVGTQMMMAVAIVIVLGVPAYFGRLVWLFIVPD
jgi:type IV secretory pathway VirB2 component (pilin)